MPIETKVRRIGNSLGIVLPKDTAKPASLFFIRGKAPHYDGMGPVVNAMIKTGEGSFDFPTGRRGDDHAGHTEQLGVSEAKQVAE